MPPKTKAEQAKDPNELIVMQHPDIEKTTRVTRRQFDKLHSKKGWKEVVPNADGSMPKDTPPLVTSDTAPAPAADTDQPS